jgi:hypothetical protein
MSEAMQESEDLSELIGDIYDAALDSSLWPTVLHNTRHFAGGHAAALLAKDAMRREGTVYHTDGGIDPHYIALYFDKYVRLDPSTTGQFHAEVGETVSTEDLIEYREFQQTRFYLEWVKPQGLVDFATTVLEKTATSAALFGVFRHERQGLVDGEMRRRLALVIPHLRRSVLIGRIIDLKSATLASLTDALDGLDAGMFLIDRGATSSTPMPAAMR